MSDAPRRLIVLLGVFVVTTAILYAVRSSGDYGLFDLLRGRPLPADPRETHKPEQFTLPTDAPLSADDVPGLARLSIESAAVAERVMPSVVSIATALTVRDEDGKRTTHKRLGAGVIVTPEGHVVTASHVVHSYEAIVVRLANDRLLRVELVGADTRMDIAVLKIISPDKDETFEALSFVDDSEKVRQGEFVFSFGNPHGLRRSVDFGIISSKERGSGDGSADLFQISTRLMPGHSGGPLVNTFGQIVGINRDNYGSKPWESVGMAVVSNNVRYVLEKLLNIGTPIYGHLGVYIDVAAVYGHLSAFDENMTYPVQVNSVTPGSAAAKAGLQRGDIITAFGGQAVDNFDTFKNLVRKRLANEKVSIDIRRNGEKMALSAAMAELDVQELFARWEGWTQERAANYIRKALGADVTNLSAAQKKRFGLLAATGGVLVKEIHARTPAEGVLMPGDVIEICNGERFGNAKQFVALLEQSPEQRVDLLVMRPMRNGARTNHLLDIVPRAVHQEDSPTEEGTPEERASSTPS